MKLTFTVFGHPEPGGSKRAFTNRRTGFAQITDANRKVGPWRQQVVGTAAEHASAPFVGPVRLELRFFRARPKGHMGTGRNEGVVKPSAPAFPDTRPDTTKLVRAVEDALTDAGLWKDDAQVVEQFASKVFGTPERVVVTVVSLPRTVGARA